MNKSRQSSHVTSVWSTVLRGFESDVPKGNDEQENVRHVSRQSVEPQSRDLREMLIEIAGSLLSSPHCVVLTTRSASGGGIACCEPGTDAG